MLVLRENYEKYPKLPGKNPKTTWKSFHNYLEKFSKLPGKVSSFHNYLEKFPKLPGKFP
jgi:hypothetical protein